MSTQAITPVSRGATIRRWVQRHAVLALCALLLIGALIGLALTSSATSRDTARSHAQLTAAQEELAQTQADLDARATQAEKDALGVDNARVAQDVLPMRGLGQTLLNWEDNASYEAQRTKLVEKYGVDPADPLLHEFMPEGPKNVDNAGNEYPYIDAMGMNSSVIGDPSLVVIGVSGTRYTYLATYTMRVQSSAGSGSSNGTVTVIATVDGDGVITGISASPSQQSVMSSGGSATSA